MGTRILSTPINEAGLSAIDGDIAAALVDPLTDLVIRAGAAILAVSRVDLNIAGKSDGSPVTDADLVADRIIGEGLARLAPTIPVISEERVHLASSSLRGSFFLIDPLDGTKEYVAGRSEFTVNLALVSEGTPLLGIIGAPALGLTWRGLVGQGAQRLTTSGSSTGVGTVIHTRRIPQTGQPWVAAVSRSHGDARTEAFIDGRPTRSGRYSVRQSNSAGSRKALLISIRDLHPLPNGTSRPAMPLSPRPEARSPMHAATP